MTPQALDWEPTGPHSAEIRLGQRVLARYVWAPDFRQPFFHPIFTPKSPSPITVYAPIDHPWHRGLWWAWKFVNGVNFWDDFEQDEAKAGIGTSLVVAHEVFKLATGGFSISQKLELRHMTTGDVVAHERRKLTLHPTVPGAPTDFSGWAMDWDNTWHGDQDLTFSTTLLSDKPWGGYGGLNFRPARSFVWKEELANGAGGRGKPEVHANTANWASYRGGSDGDPNTHPNEAGRVGMAFLTHPENLEETKYFYAYSFEEGNRTFGVLKTAPLMHGPLQLPAGEKVRLRYRVVFFDSGAELPSQALDAAWEKYAGN